MRLLELRLDIDKPLFATPAVLDFAGLKRTTLQNWIARGVITVHESRPGPGRDRLYTIADVLKIKIMAHLGDAALRSDVSAGFADAIVALFRLRQANGFAFDWREYFALDGSMFVEGKNSPNVDFEKPNFWEDWGILTTDLGDIHRFLQDELIFHARSRGLLGADGNVERQVLDPRDADEPLLDFEFQKLALGAAHLSPAIVIPIGFVVNSLMVRIKVYHPEARVAE
jgi:hypothetical protein